MDGKMSYEEMIAYGKQSFEFCAELHEEALPIEGEGAYICEKAWGGRAMMIAPDGGILMAESATSFDEHLAAFRQGMRTKMSK